MSNNKGRNMASIKISNRALILDILHRYGNLSRKEIASMIDLTPAAITLLVSEMIEEGVIVEKGETQEVKRAGRKEILIDINYDYAYVIGLNIEAEKVTIAIGDLKGNEKYSSHIDIRNINSGEQILDYISKQCIEILWKNNIPKDKIIGIGVGVIGIVDFENGMSINAYNLWEKNVPIKAILEKRLELNVTVDNNVRALAQGEIYYGHNKEANNLLFIKYGPGIGASIIINNQMYRGSSSRSAEIGHTIVNPEGKLCKCGKVGCLETVASPKAIYNSVLEVYGKERTPELYDITRGNVENINLQTIMECYTKGDKAIRDIIKKSIEYFVLGIENAVNLYDPEKVIFYGEIFENSTYLKELYGYFNMSRLYADVQNSILKSRFNKTLDTKGPIAMAIQKFFGDGGIK